MKNFSIKLAFLCLGIIAVMLMLNIMGYLNVSAFAAYYEPDPDPAISYTITQRSDGDMDLAFGGSTFRIVSNFSLPNYSWTKVGQNNSYYTVTRQFFQNGDTILVQDTFVNKKTFNVPIMMRHSVTITGIDTIGWICGNDVAGGGIDTKDQANPTVYATAGNIGLGFMAYDDVFQVHSNLWRLDNQIGLNDDQFVLRGGIGTTHTASWVIIPTKTADYWAFINAARRFRDVNITIDGGLASLGFGHNQGIHKMSDAQLLDFLKYKDVKYISAGLMDPPYKGSLGIEHTSGYIPEHPAWDPTWSHDDARTQAQRIRNLAAANGLPEIEVLGYWHSQLEWDAQLQPLYMSSPNNASILDQSGNPSWYDSSRMVFMPTLTGQGALWGTNIAACYSHMIDPLPAGVGYDGLFFDETECSAPTGDPPYHWGPVSPVVPPDPWDGCSAEINPTSHTIIRYKASVNLVTLPYRLEKMNDMKNRNGYVWGNGSPLTASMTNIKSLRLVETQAMWSGPRLAHLYMPVGLGSLYDTTPDACYIGMKDLLDRGCLYAWYYDGLSGIPTHHYPTRYMYPFTPIELHSGYVFGKERILTKNNGFFGFGDNTSTALVHVFDNTGTEVASWGNYVLYNGHRYWDLSTIAQLPAGGYACIVKKIVKLTNGSFEEPVVVNNGSYGPMTGWSSSFYRAKGSLWGLSPQDGSQFVFLHSNASFNWTTNVIEPWTTYTLTYSIGRDSDLNDTSQYQVEMFGVSERNNPSCPGYTPMTLDNSTLILSPGEWKQNTITFTTGESGGPIGKYLTVWIQSSSVLPNNYVAFDKMQLTATPATTQGFTLSGKVNLLNYSGNITSTPVTVEVGATPYTPALDAEGNFTIADIPGGTYDVRIKASHWLAKMITGVAISANKVMDPVSLINGDVVNNNEVDFSDINAVRAAYGSFPGDSTWNERADVDGSGEVDFTDINIVRSNYGAIGD